MRWTSDVLQINRCGKNAEEEMLRDFLIRLQIKPDVIDNSERPDFFVTAKGHRVAIELTLFHSDSEQHGSAGRKQFEIWAAVAHHLREQLNQQNMGNLYGSVFFKEPEAKTLAAIKPRIFIEQTVALCKNLQHLKPGCNDVAEFDGFPYLEQLLDHIHLDVGPTHKLWWCSHLQSGDVPEALPIIRKIVQEKTIKAQAYHRGDAEELWLVITARALHLWDTGLLDAEDLQGVEPILGRPFDRIFFWDKFSENIWYLSPEMRIAMHSGNKTLHVNRLPSFWRP